MSPPQRLRRTRLQGRSGRRAGLDVLELHVWADDAAPAFELAVAYASPRRDDDAALVDVGLIADEPGAPMVRAQRGACASSDVLAAALAGGAVRLRLPPFAATASTPGAAGVDVDLALDPIVEARGWRVARAHGDVSVLGWKQTLAGSTVLVAERHLARRPYAWARAALVASHEGLPLVCLIDTARTRAGSLVLPELARLRLVGPGAAKLPRSLSLGPLPARAEYGTGRLRAVALAPRLRVTVELNASIDATALFEVVDPGGEAAYAHRVLGARARLVVERQRARLFDRKRDVLIDLEAPARYEWGARAGDPRVSHRAWRG